MSLSLHFRLLFAYDKFLRGKGGEVEIGYVVLDHSVCWTTDPLNQLYNGSLKSSAAEILCGGSWYKFWYKIRPKTGSIFSGRKTGNLEVGLLGISDLRSETRTSSGVWVSDHLLVNPKQSTGQGV